MEIINVIVTERNLVNEIESFVIDNPDKREEVVIEAETYFEEKAEEIGFSPNYENTMEECVESGYYEHGDMCVSIMWSIRKNK